MAVIGEVRGIICTETIFKNVKRLTNIPKNLDKRKKLLVKTIRI